VGAVLLFLAEILLRIYKPLRSWQFSHLRQTADLAEAPTDQVLEHVKYNAGEDLAILCGFIGTGLMIVAAVYPIFRRIRVFRWMASNTMWFDFHMMAGWVGPMFIGLHSALKLDSWVAA